MSDVEHIPPWVPELSPGVRADVYPVITPTPPPELVLDRQAVTSGYSERRHPYEFGSCLPPPTPPLSSALPGTTPTFNPAQGISFGDLSKLRAGVALLRQSRPTKLQRVEQHVFEQNQQQEEGEQEATSAKKTFPLQKPSGSSSSLEDWFNKLSCGTFSTSDLSKNVPLGPAIVRAAGKVIELMASRGVPIQRAAWYIRIAVLNECVKQIRPDRPAPCPKKFWTRQLCGLLRAELEAIRNRKTALLGGMDRVLFWDYVLDLVRWQMDEGLIERNLWLQKVAAFLKMELGNVQSFNAMGTRITMSAARRFLPEFLAGRSEALLLLDALLIGGGWVIKQWRGGGKEKKVKKGVKRTGFTPNLCHREITMMLSAVLRCLGEGGGGGETKMSDLERFVKRGVAVLKKKGEAAKEGQMEVGTVRMLENVAVRGDVEEVGRKIVEKAGRKEGVAIICEWGVNGGWGTAVGALKALGGCEREVWMYLKQWKSGEDMLGMVRFLGGCIRAGVVELRSLVRDIGRLASAGEGEDLVSVLGMLGDPVEGADCRRGLLRKFGKVGGGDVNSCLENVWSGDVESVREDMIAMMGGGDINLMMSCAEVVRGFDVGGVETSKIGGVMLGIVTVLLRAEGGGGVVEWMRRELDKVVGGGGSWEKASTQRRNEAMFVLGRLIEDMGGELVKCGMVKEILRLIKRAMVGTWVSLTVRKRILMSVKALSRCVERDVWMKIVQSVFGGEDGNQKLVPLVAASLRIERKGEGGSVDEVLKEGMKEMKWDEELEIMRNLREVHEVSVAEMKTEFGDMEKEFAMDAFLGKGVTGNEVFGCVVVPLMVEAIGEAVIEGGGISRFSRLASRVLSIVAEREWDVRMQGVCTMLVVEFVALVIAGCLSGHAEAGVLLEALVEVGWFWRMVAARAGMQLAGIIRSRVDGYCNKLGGVDKCVLSALVFNMMTRLSGGGAGDESMVAAALGVEPFGMIEMQLALLATHRHECGEDQEFGSKISDAAVTLICESSARSLADAALRSCKNEEMKQVVAGLVGYGAVQAMAESLTFVVRGLTVEAVKNSVLTQERAEQWNQADKARRGILEVVVESLSQEVGVQVEPVLFEQLAEASRLLQNAAERFCLPTDLLKDGGRISDAIESRLKCIVKSQRTPQTKETWTGRVMLLGRLLRVGVMVMKKEGVRACVEALKLCIAGVGEGDVLMKEEFAELREGLKNELQPVWGWLEEGERTLLNSLIKMPIAIGAREDNLVKAFNAACVDNWELLEGYGRGPGEDAAVPPEAFGKQGGATGGMVVQLKRTYSTFASLAV